MTTNQLLGVETEFDIGDAPEFFIDVTGEGDPDSVVFILYHPATATKTVEEAEASPDVDRRWVYQMAPLTVGGRYFYRLNTYVADVLRESTGDVPIYVRESPIPTPTEGI